jgi:asparagine synthase (glutamine-hydrolysing)
MSGITLVLGTEQPIPTASRVASAMPDRGALVRLAFQSDKTALAYACFDWQEGLSGGSSGRCRDVHVVADATLYYRHELVRKLTAAGSPPASRGSADLIAAAVAAWDEEAASHLEGDFAYIAFRDSARRGHAARDPVGSRPLFHCQTPGGLAIASSPAALVRSGVAGGDLNLDWLAELCGGALNVGSETGFRAVTALRQGERLRFGENLVTRTDVWFDSPPFTENGTTKVSFADAADELRVLIADAVRERLAPDGTTCVSLSGGRDSTAVYAAGRQVAGDTVRSVSLSYPPGDAGREDETILDVLSHCGGQPFWIDTDRIPLLAHLTAESAVRPDAFQHPYEATTRAIVDAASAQGSRVVLNGLGGDTLFHSDFSYLSDKLARGQWSAFKSELHALGVRPNVRNVFRWGVLPRLGPLPRGLVAALRFGRRVNDLWDPPQVPWLAVSRAHVSQRAWREPVRRLRTHGAADRERRLMLLGPFAGRVVPEYTRISALRGVEQRSPLYDLRVLKFAATRPRAERQSGGDYKRLLRASMVGWLPPSVTDPRNTATGLTSDYFRQRLALELPHLVEGYGDRLLVDEFGLVFASLYRAEVDRLARTGEHESTPALVFTALTESWLRQQG